MKQSKSVPSLLFVFFGLISNGLALQAADSVQAPSGALLSAQDSKGPLRADQDQDTEEDTAASNEGRQETSPVASSFELRYKFQAGELLRWHVEHLVTVKTTIQGTTQKAETRSHSTKAWRVISVNLDGDAVFAHMVEDVDMWQKVTGRQEIRFNSKSDKKPPPEYVNAAASVGVPLSTITLSATGKVIERNDRQGMPQDDHSLITMPLPDRPVNVNEKWDTPYIIPVRKPDGTVINIQARQVFQLTKVVAGLATVSLATEVLTPVRDPRIKAQLVQRLSNGIIKFDISAGRVKSQRMDSKESVLAFSGADSEMDYKARFTEDLVSADVVSADSEPTAQAEPKSGEPGHRKPIRTADGRSKTPNIRQ